MISLLKKRWWDHFVFQDAGGYDTNPDADGVITLPASAAMAVPIIRQAKGNRLIATAEVRSFSAARPRIAARVRDSNDVNLITSGANREIYQDKDEGQWRVLRAETAGSHPDSDIFQVYVDGLGGGSGDWQIRNVQIYVEPTIGVMGEGIAGFYAGDPMGDYYATMNPRGEMEGFIKVDLDLSESDTTLTLTGGNLIARFIPGALCHSSFTIDDVAGISPDSEYIGSIVARTRIISPTALIINLFNSNPRPTSRVIPIIVHFKIAEAKRLGY